MAYVALGSNMGDRNAHLAAARAALAVLPQSRIVAESPIEETEPLGGMAQTPYLNQMVALETALTPRALLGKLQSIEEQGGRTRSGRWEPRTIDLDIVLFGSRSVAEDDLTIPHPGLADRDFWQRELSQLRTLLSLTVRPE